jgi:hypothetical protein
VATGVVIAAQGPDAASVDHFTLRTSDGRQLDFAVGKLDLSDGGLPAPHLREHMVSGEPITVSYELQDGQLVAVRYVDAAD